MPSVDLEVLRSSKDLFISIAAHKLLGPVTILKWNIELMMRDTQLSEKSREKLADMQNAVKKLEDFGSVLLKIIQAKSGDEVTAPQEIVISPAKVVSELLNEFKDEIAEKNLKVEVKIPDELKVNIKCEDYVVRELLRSLIKNAVSYNKKDGLVEVSIKESDKLTIIVKDTGIGIPHKEQSLIGEAFVRSSNSQKLTVKGNGLDLYLCKLILKHVNGRIWFETEEDAGSTFSVELPLKHNV